MKSRDFERIAKQLLPLLSGFAINGNLLFIAPIRHLLKGVFFNPSADKHSFYVQVFVQPMYVPSEQIVFNFGFRLGGNAYAWDGTAPSLAHDLMQAIIKQAVPFLDPIHTPGEMLAAAKRIPLLGDPMVREAIAYAWARIGDAENGIPALNELIPMLVGRYEWQKRLQARAELLKSMLLTDPGQAQRQLDIWEIETVRNLGLERFLERRVSTVPPRFTQ